MKISLFVTIVVTFVYCLFGALSPVRAEDYRRSSPTPTPVRRQTVSPSPTRIQTPTPTNTKHPENDNDHDDNADKDKEHDNNKDKEKEKDSDKHDIPSVPEFGLFTGVIALLGTTGSFIFLKKNK